MRKLNSLEEVNASALPAKVLALLSMYANALRKHNGLILKLSSLNVFRHVYNTRLVAMHPDVHAVYHELLEEVRGHVYNGTMYTNDHKRFKNIPMPRASRPQLAAKHAQVRKLNRVTQRNRNHGDMLGSCEVEPSLSAFG